jgi:hypothetical protein
MNLKSSNTHPKVRAELRFTAKNREEEAEIHAVATAEVGEASWVKRSKDVELPEGVDVTKPPQK